MSDEDARSSAVLTLVFAAAAHAQTDGVERLEILVQGATISSPGGEEFRVAGGANPNEPGKTVRHGFSVLPDGCVWFVSRVVEPAADLGWAVEITPVRVVDDAVTFRLAWARTRDEGKASTQSRSDRELTLRPGESIPLDSGIAPVRASRERSARCCGSPWSVPRSGRRSPAAGAGSLACREAQRRYRAKPAAVAAWPVSPADSLLLRLDYRGSDGARHLRRSHGGSGRSHERREDHDAQPDLRSEPAPRQALPSRDNGDDQNHAERSRVRPVAEGRGWSGVRLAGVVIENSGASASMRLTRSIWCRCVTRCGRRRCWSRVESR